MLALSPTSLSTFGWPLEDPISHLQNYNSREAETSESLLNFPLTQPQIGIGNEISNFGTIGDDGKTTVKKLNHNASERDRRKRINNLYFTLRSLLPEADQMKKLSIPATVSRVLKYIPELQKEVERLVEKKEKLLSKVTKRGDKSVLENKRKVGIQSSLGVVLANQLNEREIMIQISTVKINQRILSEVLLNLEEDGLLLLNASSFESFGERIFHILHLQVQGINHNKVEPEMLREKLLSLYEKREKLFT